MQLETGISVYAVPTYHKQERFDTVLVKNYTKYKLDSPWVCIRQLFKFACGSITNAAWVLKALDFVDSSYLIDKSTEALLVKFTESFCIMQGKDIWQSVHLVENLHDHDGSY